MSEEPWLRPRAAKWPDARVNDCPPAATSFSSSPSLRLLSASDSLTWWFLFLLHVLWVLFILKCFLVLLRACGFSFSFKIGLSMSDFVFSFSFLFVWWKWKWGNESSMHFLQFFKRLKQVIYILNPFSFVWIKEVRELSFCVVFLSYLLSRHCWR